MEVRVPRMQSDRNLLTAIGLSRVLRKLESADIIIFISCKIKYKFTFYFTKDWDRAKLLVGLNVLYFKTIFRNCWSL